VTDCTPMFDPDYLIELVTFTSSYKLLWAEKDVFFLTNAGWQSKCELVSYAMKTVQWFFMGLCFSCRKSRLNSVKSEHFSASATPLHVCVEERRRPELGSSSKEICQYSAYIRMANTMSNMKMTNPIKGLVSKRRKRYTQDGFNLDLTCILCC
jgi:hypothetical protein